MAGPYPKDRVNNNPLVSDLVDTTTYTGSDPEDWDIPETQEDPDE
jgi:hypothetical protein